MLQQAANRVTNLEHRVFTRQLVLRGGWLGVDVIPGKIDVTVTVTVEFVLVTHDPSEQV